MPRAARKAQVRTDDLSGARTEASIAATGAAEAQISRIEVIPEAMFREKAEDEAFMNEYIVIQIEASEDPNAPTFIQSGHNGIDQYIQRGIPQKIKRKFLYSLVAGKRTQFACSFGKDGSGNEFNRLPGRTNTTHRLSIIEDTQRGRDAFVRWMQQPA